MKLKQAETIDVRFRPPEWYDETVATDVRHLLDVPGVYVTETDENQAVYLTFEDITKLVKFREKFGWDLEGLVSSCILGLCQRDHLPYKGVMYYRVVGKDFVLALRVFKRQLRRRWFLFDTKSDFPGLTSQMLEEFVNDPDHSDDLAA